MASTPVLCQQSQNKIKCDFQRMKNELNKFPAQPTSFKLLSATHSSKQDGENKDPVSSEIGWKAPVRPGVSKLPVLQKSLHLQTTSDFSQSHCRWEEKPLAGKAKKKKPCTRPIPFNLSQPKSSRMANEKQRPLTVSQPRIATRPVQPNATLKSQNSNVKPAKHPTTLDRNMDANKGTGKSKGMATGNRSHLPGSTVPPNTSETSVTLSRPPSSTSNNANTEACLHNLNLLSLKDPTKTSHDPQYLKPKALADFSKSSTDKGEDFQLDHAALISILRNEGVGATGVGFATPHSKPYNYLPQRVSIMKSRQKAGPTTGSVKFVHFSPDAAALQSILQNEGVKGGGPVGATPKNSVCPSGRNTSIYTAQRVPVRKNHGEATAGAVETPLQKWMPQRVRNTRNQQKGYLSTQQSPYIGTPVFSCKKSLQPCREEIVQRLFDDPEDEQTVTEKEPETQQEQLSTQSTITKSRSEDVEQTSKTNCNEVKRRKIVGIQPFIQDPQRESVIFFSTGKKLLRAPRFEQQLSSSGKEQQSLSPSTQRKVQPAEKEISSVSEASCQINPFTAQSLHRDPGVQKTCAQSSAVAMLRKRLPTVEELLIDEEVATYSSVSLLTAPGSQSPRPRCGNPLASTLLYDESTRFVPIHLDLSYGPSSPLSSAQQDR